MKKKTAGILLCASLLMGITACTSGKTTENPLQKVEMSTETPLQVMKTVNLMEDVEAEAVMLDNLPLIPIMKFGVPLLQNAVEEAEKGENVLVSPMSAWTALCMTELGALGETDEQMQQVLGVSDRNHLSYLHALTKKMSAGADNKVHMANGIWFKNVESLHVKEEFLKQNKALLDATAYKAPFNEETRKNINQWVSEQTDGMVREILKEIKEEDVIYLVNALSFDGEWQKIYNETEVWDGTFTTEAGEEQPVPMMHSKETVYLEDERATGFVKYYKGQDYAFVALLPKEGITVADYVQNLSAEGLSKMLDAKSRGTVEVTMPKFSVEYGLELNDILKQMGMETAFSERDADFSAMATSDVGNIYVSRVNQRCFLSVDERGTKAGAATAVAMANKMAMMDIKVVNLNRPFVYLLIECEYNEPLFMGTMMNVKED